MTGETVASLFPPSPPSPSGYGTEVVGKDCLGKEGLLGLKKEKRRKKKEERKMKNEERKKKKEEGLLGLKKEK